MAPGWSKECNDIREPAISGQRISEKDEDLLTHFSLLPSHENGETCFMKRMTILYSNRQFGENMAEQEQEERKNALPLLLHLNLRISCCKKMSRNMMKCMRRLRMIGVSFLHLTSATGMEMDGRMKRTPKLQKVAVT